MSTESPQDIRRAEQQAHFTQAHIDIAVLKVVVETLAKDVKVMGDQVSDMNKLLSEAKGGWKVIAAAAGVAGVLGSALSWFVAHLGVFRQ
jgi:hypothetical protein